MLYKQLYNEEINVILAFTVIWFKKGSKYYFEDGENRL